MTNVAEPLYDVFIDESSQNNHRYLVLGGIILPTALVATFTHRVMESRLPELPAAELKWGKVSKAKADAYKRVVDLFFEEEFRSQIQFHSAVVDVHKQNHTQFSEGDNDLGFNKELFQLARKFARLYNPARFHIYPDERKTRQSPNDLRTILNRHVHKTQPHRDWPYRRVQFRDSKSTPILQLTDLLIGGLAFVLNGHDRAEGASPPKRELSRHILARAGIRDVFRDTAMSGKFTVWHRKLK